MVKFCDKCGEELKNENAKFCDKCGAEVKMSSNQNSAGTANLGGVVVCPHCGQTTPMGSTNCEKCGSSLENNTVAVMVGYVVSFLLPIIGLIPAIYLLTRDNGKAKTQGVLLIGLIVVFIILNLIFRSWIAYLVILLLMIGGVVLWFNDFTLF